MSVKDDFKPKNDFNRLKLMFFDEKVDGKTCNTVSRLYTIISQFYPTHSSVCSLVGFEYAS